MYRHRLLLIVAALATLLVAIGARANEEKPDVHVPVVLDGVRHGPDEFNAIYEEKSAQGVKFWFAVTKDSIEGGFIYAFTSEDAFREFSRKHEAGASNSEGETLAMSVCISPESYWSYHYEDADCGGDVLAVEPGIGIDNLGPMGWNERISSVVTSTGIDEDVLYKDADFQGSTLGIPASSTYANLGSYGWNDEASSLATFQ